jgi:hypothetical protein
MRRLVQLCLFGRPTWPLSKHDSSRIIARGFSRLFLRVALLLLVTLGPVLVIFTAVVALLPSEGPFNDQEMLSWPRLGIVALAMLPVCGALAWIATNRMWTWLHRVSARKGEE